MIVSKTFRNPIHPMIGCLWLVSFFCAPAHSQSQSQSQSISRSSLEGSTVERGVAGTKLIHYSGKPLRAKSQRDADASIVIRLAVSPADRSKYEATFLGTRVGTYDLSKWIEHADGSEATDLPACPVEVVSTLTNDQRSDLFDAAKFEAHVWGGYRLSACLIGLIWIGIPIVVLVRRAMNRKTIEAPPAVQKTPTFAERLKPLVEAAVAGKLSIREKGQLELLLLHYWRERNSLQEVDMATAIGQLRQHPEAGQLITHIERWLHQSSSSSESDACSAESIKQLLEPYCIDVVRSAPT